MCCTCHFDVAIQLLLAAARHTAHQTWPATRPEQYKQQHRLSPINKDGNKGRITLQPFTGSLHGALVDNPPQYACPAC